MKLTDLDTSITTRRPRRAGAARSGSAPRDGDVEVAEPLPELADVVPDPGADSITASRLVAPYHAGRWSSGPSEVTTPPPLRFVAEDAGRTPISSRTATVLIVVVVMAGLMWALVGSGTGSRSSGSHKARVQLATSHGQVVAAARAWAVAIEKAWRDRGTDAELQDTIPAATPPPAGTAGAP